MAPERFVFVLILISIFAVPAEGDAPDVFRKFGLEGVWSPDCGRRPSMENPWVYWRIPAAGPIVHAVTFDGRTFALTDTVSDAVLLSANRMKFSIVRHGTVNLTAVVERSNERMHVVTSIGVDGTIYYRDGIEIATGKPALADERCDVSSPVS
jgi:hypothetical protein